MAIALTLLGGLPFVSNTKKPRIVDSLLSVFSFFLLHDYMTLAFSKDALCFVKQRENQIVLTLGALLQYTDVEL